MAIVRHECSKIYAKVVEAGGMVYTAGITPTELSADIKGQTVEVLAEIDRLLALGGTDKTRLVSATIWLNDIRHREAMNEAWTAWTGGEANAPVRACVEAKLVDQRMLVEIAVIATK
jgi:enamine deaminase RidA (YjgF/YER057c/UK114 family)